MPQGGSGSGFPSPQGPHAPWKGGAGNQRPRLAGENRHGPPKPWSLAWAERVNWTMGAHEVGRKWGLAKDTEEGYLIIGARGARPGGAPPRALGSSPRPTRRQSRHHRQRRHLVPGLLLDPAPRLPFGSHGADTSPRARPFRPL